MSLPPAASSVFLTTSFSPLFILQERPNYALHQPTTAIYPYSSREESMKCNRCDRSFRKASELTLHQYTHDLEKHTRNKMFQCAPVLLVVVIDTLRIQRRGHFMQAT
ncbi:unnamed protein product [Haemonchus placei]|uniref:C2H2-type domain-containing protein n=1 Tax=Haemonchus placei TaxID=6290 RepID=A0A158QPY3_HAEPC|nr:unnamed protein product [Haemonchus placei]